MINPLTAWLQDRGLTQREGAALLSDASGFTLRQDTLSKWCSGAALPGERWHEPLKRATNGAVSRTKLMAFGRWLAQPQDVRPAFVPQGGAGLADSWPHKQAILNLGARVKRHRTPGLYVLDGRLVSFKQVVLAANKVAEQNDFAFFIAYPAVLHRDDADRLNADKQGACHVR